MKFKILCSFLLLSALSCDPVNLEDNMRLQVKGFVQDMDGNPIPDAEITVDRHYNNSYLGFLLGSGKSANDGSFSVVSMFEKIEEFTVNISLDESYTKYSYRANMEDYTPFGLVIDLEEVVLVETARFNYHISRTSTEDATLQFEFIYSSDSCVDTYDQGELIAEQSHCYETRFRNGSLDQNPSVSSNFSTLLGSTVEFRYSINDQPEQIQIFTIDQTNYDFNFEF